MPRSFYKETEILLRAVAGKKTLFLSHVRPDWDTLASAYALSQFFSKKAKTACFGLCEKTKQKNKHPFFSHYSPAAKVIERLSDFDAVVCVDFRSPAQAGPLSSQFASYKGKLIVLDHHHRSTQEFSPRAQFLLHPSSVATAQMATQIGQEMGIEFSKPVASALAVALLTDSVRFLMANEETFSVMDFLLAHSGKSYEKLFEMANPPLSTAARLSILKSMRNIRVYEIGDYILAIATNPYHGSLTANALVQIGADVGVGMFRANDGIFSSVRVSARAHSALQFDSMKLILPFALQNNGTAGGHARAAQLNLPAYFSEALVRDFFERTLLEKVRARDKKAVVRKR